MREKPKKNLRIATLFFFSFLFFSFKDQNCYFEQLPVCWCRLQLHSQLNFSLSLSFCSILIGAPKANTSQPNVTEGGAVYLCPWSQANCTVIDFDKQGELAWFHWSFTESSLCFLCIKLYHVTSSKLFQDTQTV